jgi:hypothetical protein
MTLPLSVAVLVLTAACAIHSQQTPPSVDARVAHSRDSLPTVETSVTVPSARLSRGDLIDLIVTATNHGTQRVTIGVACGPSLDALVQYPDATAHSALWDSVAPQVEFDCPGGPSHFADPGQTKTERIAWRVPAIPGTYHLRAALRRGDGLGNVSRAVDVIVP